MRPKRVRNYWITWLRWFAAWNLILMGGVIAFVAAVDPYQLYHPVLGGRPRFNVQIQRFLVPGLARTSNYEVALAGTSFLQNIPNSAVRRICGKPAVNLCMSGASIHEEASAMRLALEHKGIKTIIATIDYNSLSGGRLGQVINVNFAFPEYLYDGSPFDKLPYLLSWDSIATSIHAVWGKDTPDENENPDWPWKFPATMKFDASDAVRGINPRNINARYGMTNLELPAMEKAFGDNIFPLLRQYPNVRIHFVFPPYSILVWHDFRQRNQIPVYFAFKKWMVDQAQRFGNFDVIDFQDRADIITNLSLYADIYHSNESVDEQMVRAACEGAQVLNRQNVESRTANLLRLVETTDPVEIVKVAASHNGQN
ncbi:MAG TPA: hypothetical protein VK789_27050 [Bryobacteraceae bacterium]|nr:hypothetical protein [Bryobacteraceae bacterium]